MEKDVNKKCPKKKVDPNFFLPHPEQGEAVLIMITQQINIDNCWPEQIVTPLICDHFNSDMLEIREERKQKIAFFPSPTFAQTLKLFEVYIFSTTKKKVKRKKEKVFKIVRHLLPFIMSLLLWRAFYFEHF